MLIQPRRGLLQLAADLVLGEQIKYAGLDRAFLAHDRLRRWQVALASATENYPTRSGPACAKTPIPQMFQNVSVCGRNLASSGGPSCLRTCSPPSRATSPPTEIG